MINQTLLLSSWNEKKAAPVEPGCCKISWGSRFIHLRLNLEYRVYDPSSKVQLVPKVLHSWQTPMSGSWTLLWDGTYPSALGNRV